MVARERRTKVETKNAFNRGEVDGVIINTAGATGISLNAGARFADQRIGATAWNNRLSALATKGLLVERKQGKSKSFSPLLEIA